MTINEAGAVFSNLSNLAGLVRFVPEAAPSRILIGEPLSPKIDVGAAMFQKDKVYVYVWSGNSVLAPGVRTEHKELLGRLLSPLAHEDVGTIRCIGLNVSLSMLYHFHNLRAPPHHRPYVAFTYTCANSIYNMLVSSTQSYQLYHQFSCKFFRFPEEILGLSGLQISNSLMAQKTF
jgi:hypothetical protein